MSLQGRDLDPESPLRESLWPDWGWVALFWLLLGGVALLNAWVSECLTADGSGPTWFGVASRQLPPYLLWALFTPAIFWAARRFSPRSDRWIRSGLLHLGGAVLFVVVAGAYRAWVHDLLVHGLEEGHAWQNLFSGGFLTGYELDLFVYGGLLGGIWATDAYREARERKRREAQLEKQLDDARYRALRMQMQPHFLFNTLNTVSALVERDPGATRRVVARLSDLLRRVLDGGEEQETTLGEELAFVGSYLEIEQVRFEDRLEVEIEVGAELETALVPALVLQPLVENAIRHGIARSPWKGRIRVQGERHGDELVLTVTDTGPGLDPATPTRGSGTALENTRRRLQELYGDAARLNLGPAPGGGCRAEIRVPFRTSERAAGEEARLADAG